MSGPRTFVLGIALFLAASGCVRQHAPDRLSEFKAASANVAAGATGPQLIPAPPSPNDAWMRHAVIYGVVPPLFGHPPLQQVTKRLDHLASLGVDALWLSPVYATDDPSLISYAPVDFQAVRPDYGTGDDLKALIAAAHARNMKVILDFIPNHVSSGHPAFVDAQARGEASPYYRWFERDAEGRPTHYFDWEALKNLDYDRPEVEQLITEGFLHWVRTFDVDGFRVDAAWGVKDRAPAFWKRLEAALRAEKPEVFLLAEASARDPFYVRNGFDAAYDWTGRLGEWAWADAFSDLSQVGPRLSATIGVSASPAHRVARFLNNNDTGGRFISRHGPEVTKLAATLQHLLPGIAILFTGDEVGAEYEPYEDPPPLDFTDKHGLVPHFTKLATLRETLPAVREGDYLPVPVKENNAVFAFVRAASPEELALVVLNFGEAAEVTLVPPSVPGLSRMLEGPLQDALGATVQGASLSSEDAFRLTLPARSGQVLVPPTSAAPAGPRR